MKLYKLHIIYNTKKIKLTLNDSHWGLILNIKHLLKIRLPYFFLSRIFLYAIIATTV